MGTKTGSCDTNRDKLTLSPFGELDEAAAIDVVVLDFLPCCGDLDRDLDWYDLDVVTQ